MFEREIWDCRFDYVPDMRSDAEIEAERESKESEVGSQKLNTEMKMIIKMPCDFKLRNLDKYPKACQHCYFDRVQAHLRTIPLASITMAHGAKLKGK